MIHPHRPMRSVGKWLLIVLVVIGALVAVRRMVRGGDAPTAPPDEHEDADKGSPY